jgi:hypothetical protein
VTVEGHRIAYCRGREDIKLFRLLLSPYSLKATWNNVQNWIFFADWRGQGVHADADDDVALEALQKVY